MHRSWRASPILLKAFDTFIDLADEDISQLVNSCELREYKAGHVLINQDEQIQNVFFILSGALKLSRKISTSPSKDETPIEVIVQLFGPGEAIGDVALFTDFKFKGTVRAIATCEVLAIRKNVLTELVEANPRVLKNLYQRTSLKFLKIIEGVDLSYGKLMDRIEVLAQECNHIGIDLYKHFTKSEIARMLGVSRVSVSQNMNINRDCG